MAINDQLISSLVQAELSINPPITQLPSYPSAPSGFLVGQFYQNTTDGLIYVMTENGFKPLDNSEYVQLTGVDGTHIIFD